MSKPSKKEILIFFGFLIGLIIGGLYGSLFPKQVTETRQELPNPATQSLLIKPLYGNVALEMGKKYVLVVKETREAN